MHVLLCYIIALQYVVIDIYRYIQYGDITDYI